MTKHEPLATSAPLFSREGYSKIRDGEVLAVLMPDWVAGVFKFQIPKLAGKVKLMPLPAWQHNRRRTSVRGAAATPDRATA